MSFTLKCVPAFSLQASQQSFSLTEFISLEEKTEFRPQGHVSLLVLGEQVTVKTLTVATEAGTGPGFVATLLEDFQWRMVCLHLSIHFSLVFYFYCIL